MKYLHLCDMDIVELIHHSCNCFPFIAFFVLSFLFSLIFLNIIVFSGYWSYLVTEYFQLFPPIPYVIAVIHFIYVYVIIIQYIVTAINLHKQLYFRSLKNNNNDKKRFHFPFFYPFFESLPLCWSEFLAHIIFPFHEEFFFFLNISHRKESANNAFSVFACLRKFLFLIHVRRRYHWIENFKLQVLLFNIEKISSSSLIACIVSNMKSTLILIFCSSIGKVFLSLISFKIVSLSLVF